MGEHPVVPLQGHPVGHGLFQGFRIGHRQTAHLIHPHLGVQNRGIQQGKLLVGLIRSGGEQLVLRLLPLDRFHDVQPDGIHPGPAPAILQIRAAGEPQPAALHTEEGVLGQGFGQVEEHDAGVEQVAGQIH